MVNKGKKNWAVVFPPPLFRQGPKENLFFYRSPSLTPSIRQYIMYTTTLLIIVTIYIANPHFLFGY